MTHSSPDIIYTHSRQHSQQLIAIRLTAAKHLQAFACVFDSHSTLSMTDWYSIYPASKNINGSKMFHATWCDTLILSLASQQNHQQE